MKHEELLGTFGADHTKPRVSPTSVLGEVNFSNQLDAQITAHSVCRAR
jgi:hypothetical protein